jgi:hypothetical protein
MAKQDKKNEEVVVDQETADHEATVKAAAQAMLDELQAQSNSRNKVEE